jgi:hypothetical protein
LDLLTIAATKQQAQLASADHCNLQGLDLDIDPERAPKNFKDAISRKDRQEWAEALNKECRGFKDRNALAVDKPPRSKDPRDTDEVGVQEGQQNAGEVQSTHGRKRASLSRR